MVEIQDRAAQGRACGNLGNVHYLLGDFTKAIHFHEERLKIAREFGDRSAERRAHSNLGNAHIFLGEFEAAAEHYKMTLGLAQELGDRAVEAQVRPAERPHIKQIHNRFILHLLKISGKPPTFKEFDGTFQFSYFPLCNFSFY